MNTKTGTIAGSVTAESGTVMKWELYNLTFCGDTARYLNVDYFNSDGTYIGMFREGQPELVEGFFKENGMAVPTTA